MIALETHAEGVILPVRTRPEPAATASRAFITAPCK